MAYPHRDFEERAAELRDALATLRSEVDELHTHLQGAARARRHGDRAESEGGGARVRPAAQPALDSRSTEPADTSRALPGAATATVTAAAEASDEEVVPEQLTTQSDGGLAKTFDIATSLLGDAEDRQDPEAIAYWRGLAEAALEEAARRPEFGKESGASRLSPKRIAERRRRRLIEQLAQARDRYTVRQQ